MVWAVVSLSVFPADGPSFAASTAARTMMAVSAKATAMLLKFAFRFNFSEFLSCILNLLRVKNFIEIQTLGFCRNAGKSAVF